MTSFVGLLVLSLLSLVFVYLDRRIWGFVLSPGVVLTVGYTAIVGIYSIARLFYDFGDVQWSTYAVLAGFTIVCMACSVAAAALLRWRPAESQLAVRETGRAPRWMIILALMLFLPLATITSLGNGGLWSSDARDAMSSGIIGHLHVLLAFCTVWYSVGASDRAWLKVPILSAAVVVLSLYPVKGWTLIPLTAVIFVQSQRTSNRRLGWKYLPLLAVAGVAVFFTVYLARTEFDATDREALASVLGGIFEHLIFYLTAGLFGLDAVVGGLRLSGGAAVLFAPIHNLVAQVTKDTIISPISDVYIVGMANQDAGGNVYSFLGSLIAYAGPVAGTLCALAMVMLAYILLGAGWRLRSGPFRAAAIYIVATLAFGWFEYYFWHLTPYEVIAIGLMLSALMPLFRTRQVLAPSLER